MAFLEDTYPFDEKGARVTRVGIIQKFKEETNALLVDGFRAVIDMGDGKKGENRIAGFMETHNKAEYLIDLNAKKPLVYESDAVGLQGEEFTVFIFSMGFGNGSLIPQPSGLFNIYVNDVFCLSIRNVNYSFYWKGTQSEFVFSMRRCETAPAFTGMQLSELIKDESQAAFGIGLLKVKSDILTYGNRATIKIEAICEYESKRYFYLSDCPGIIEQANLREAALILSNRNIRQSGKYNVYFGDIHTHSGQLWDKADNTGCGMGSMEDNYRYAKGAGGLHFYALTDHERQIIPHYEKEYFELADQYNKDGEFVCIKAFEHTSLFYGHRNIYFKNDAKAVHWYENGNAVEPKELFRRLEGFECFSIPHHSSSASHPCNIELIEGKDVCCEVYSVWGSSEYWGDFPRGVSDRHDSLWVSNIFEKNLKLGIVASADGHDGHPGNAQSPYPKHPHQFHFCGSGLTAVLSDELSREKIYEAIKNRRCYGTTGAPIILDFKANGFEMGQIITKTNTKPQLFIRCEGTNSIVCIRIIKNGKIIHTEACNNLWKYEFSFTDENYGHGVKVNYYIRVLQVDMESAWSSPIFFE
jgi:hypothetical protein